MAGNPSYQEVLQSRNADNAAMELDQVFGAAQSPLGEADNVRSGATIAMDILNQPAPPRARPGDKLGRPQVPESKRSTAGNVLHSVGEIAPSALKGIHNAIMMTVDPLADWLNENVVDLTGGGKYTYKLGAPDTMTGQITQDMSQFLTGFIPAVKALKTVGVTNAVANPMAAGAIADFFTRGGHDGRLADLWKQHGLPENVLTDWLASDGKDSEIEGRFKNAVEGMALGSVTEVGFKLAASAVRGYRHLTRGSEELAKTEESFLKDKYGELSDEQLHAATGNPNLPMIETKVVQPPAVSKKIPKAEKGLPNLEPRSVIRSKKAVKTQVPGEALTDFSNIFKGETLAGAERKILTPNSTKERVVWMSPDEYLSLARDRNIAYEQQGLTKEQIGYLAEEKRAPIREAIFSGEKLDEIPWLDIDGVNVVGHDGRHRMDELKAMGIDKVPVVVKGNLPKAGTEILSEEGTVRVVMPEAIAPPPPKPSIKSEDFEVYINFAHIDEPDQVKFAIGKMAEAMKGSVDEARRGKIAQEETIKMADELGMTVPELLERRKGQPFNAEEALAARQLWAASGEKLLELAKAAAGPNAGALDQFTFRRQMAIHAAIQNEVIGARTETARALASWKIPAGGGVEKARAIEQVMSAMGGPGASQEMARRLAILAHTGASPAAIAKFARQGAAATSWDAIKQVWINGLLSSPKTHVVNVLSNSVVVSQQIYERAVAGGISALRGEEGVVFGEATAMLHALLTGYKDSFRLAAKALKTGETGFAFNKIDVSTPNAISAEAFNLTKDNGMAKFVDVLGHATEVPGRLLGAEDEFFKSIGYRMEVAAQAVRQARHENLSGEAFSKRVAELTNDPPETIRINAADAAMYNTFTNELGKWGQGMMKLRENIPPLVLVAPFIRTPANIARYTFERTPFAPLVGQWRADIAAGGARADLALARMATGTAIMATALDWAASGTISGEGPSSKGEDKDAREALLRSGWQPYSIRIGDRWYSYNRTDPLGMMLGISASIHEAVQKGEMDEEDVDEWQEVAAMTIAAVSNNIVNKTYLSGMSNLVEMLNEPKRYSQGYINDMVASFLPFTAAAGAVKNVVDPIQREAQTPLEAIQAKIAGLSENLPPRRDLWGRPISTESGLGRVYDSVSPISSRKENVQPVDFEINRLGEGPLRISKKASFDGVRVNLRKWPQVYDEYVKLAGNELKHPAWGMGAMDYLNAVVSGKHPISPVFEMMSDDVRRDFISTVITEYRTLAQQQIMGDPKYIEFAASVTQAKALQMQRQMPVTGE